ncbi:MAG TPA: CocE/NonD family hydrolase [Gemmataceae bacterium]|nr:CocE/NonD family hydrolase [Gemmataceae bacterium]
MCAVPSRSRTVATICGLLLLAFVSSGPAADPPKKPAGDKPPALPAPLSGFKDEGTFALYLNEDRLATITFRWQTNGTYDNKCTLALAGQKVTTTLHITPDKDGRWVKLDIKSPRGPVTVERTGGLARHTFEGKVVTLNLKPEAVLFDSYSPALISQVIRRYDQAKGGKQKFPACVDGALMSELNLERKEPITRAIGGKDQKFQRFDFLMLGVEMHLWTGADGKVYLGEVPSQHAAFVRDGYELLRRLPANDPLLSAPKYQITVEHDVGVPMRDGVKLTTDIYRPEGPAKAPVILVRTPYQKNMAEAQAHYYARRGYAVAVQNCRGRFGSGGTWEPFIHEPKDGYDTIEWLAAQPWSTGKVGMIGGSYVGWVQWWAASEHPPHLVTIIPNVSPPDPFYNIPYEYGVFFLKAAIWWAEILDKEATADLSGNTLYHINKRKYHELLRSLPVIDLDKAVLGKVNPYWRQWIAHPTNDSYWQQASFLDKLKDVNLPVYHQSGWFDGDGIGSKLNYLRMVSFGHPNQKLVLGPWGHTDESARRFGDRDFGPTAIVDLQRSYLRWFDYWLKGIDNGILKEPLVRIFVMGSNRWLEGNVYPLPQTRFEKWYLTSAGHAQTSKGDGKLSWELPAADTPADHYTYDPGDPTPDPDDYEEPDGPKDKVQSREEKVKAAETYHEKVTQARHDILVFTSEPMRQPLTFAGPLSAVIYASSSAKDTDWFVRLMEVEKSGKLFPLAEGKIRARFRRSMQTPELLTPGKVYEYKLDLWQTGITIPAGYRLRVEVASASFPEFSRNLNTGGHNETETKYVKAEQVLYHNQWYPSHVLLPVIDLKAEKR